MDNRKWVYLLFATTASAYGLGEAELGAVQAAVPETIARYAEKDLGPVAIETVESFGVSQLCADAQAKLGITAAQCTVEKICKAGILLTCSIDSETSERSWNARSHNEMKATGNFTPNEPL